MTVFVNHKEVKVEESSKLNALLESLNLSNEGIALAVDNKVIPRNSWESFELSENMKVTLIKATQGG